MESFNTPPDELHATGTTAVPLSQATKANLPKVALMIGNSVASTAAVDMMTSESPPFQALCYFFCHVTFLLIFSV